MDDRIDRARRKKPQQKSVDSDGMRDTDEDGFEPEPRKINRKRKSRGQPTEEQTISDSEVSRSPRASVVLQVMRPPRHEMYIQGFPEDGTTHVTAGSGR